MARYGHLLVIWSRSAMRKLPDSGIRHLPALGTSKRQARTGRARHQVSLLIGYIALRQPHCASLFHRSKPISRAIGGGGAAPRTIASLRSSILGITTSKSSLTAYAWAKSQSMSDCGDNPAERTPLNQVKQSSSPIDQREGLSHNRFDCAGCKQRDNTLPGFSKDRAYWMPGCPRAPIPCTPTRSSPRKPALQRL